MGVRGAKSCRYDELRVGNIIWFHGARERIVSISSYPNDPDNPYYGDAKTVIRFELEPADENAVKILGKFYSHGTYGGVGSLIVNREV